MQGAASFGSGIASHPSFGEVQRAGEPAPKRQEEQWANRSVVKFCTSWIRRYLWIFPRLVCMKHFYADQNDRKPVLHDSHSWLSYAKISKHISVIFLYEGVQSVQSCTLLRTTRMHLGTSGVFFNLFSTSKTLKIQLALLVSPHRWYHLQIGSQKMACGRSGRLSKKPTGCCSLYEIKRHLGVLNVDLYTYRGASPHKNHHFRWMKYGMYLEVSISCRYQCRIYIYI